MEEDFGQSSAFTSHSLNGAISQKVWNSPCNIAMSKDLCRLEIPLSVDCSVYFMSRIHSYIKLL